MRAALTLAVCLLVWGQAAWGHAALVSAAPAPGAVLDQAPDGVTLTFSEPVSVTALRLLDPQGQTVDLTPADAGGVQIRIPWPLQATQGDYLLSWRVVSADGHPVGGTLDYALGAGGAQVPVGAAPAAGASSGRALAIWLGRWLGYLCLFAAAGAALFRARLPADRQSWAQPLIGLGLVLLPVNLGLQGLDLLDAPVSALAGGQAWAVALGSRYAWTLGLSACALLAAAMALQARRPALQRGAAGLSLGLTGLAFAASGHAGTAPPQWLSRPLVVVHGVMAVAWLGALVPLIRSVCARPGTTTDVSGLGWFSRWITPVVGGLLLSGLGLACLQLDRPADVWQTDYGQVLGVKLLLVLGLLAIAAFNRWRCTGPVLAGEPVARTRLRRSMMLETVVAVALLGVVSLWRFTPPPRSLDAASSAAHPTGQAEEAVSVVLADAHVRAEVRRAAGEWTIRLQTPAGEVFQAQELALVLRNPDAGIEPLRRAAHPLGDGRWRLDGGALPPLGTGHWQLGLEILIDDFDRVVLTGEWPA